MRANDDGAHALFASLHGTPEFDQNCPRTSAKPISLPRELNLHIEFPASRTDVPAFRLGLRWFWMEVAHTADFQLLSSQLNGPSGQHESNSL